MKRIIEKQILNIMTNKLDNQIYKVRTLKEELEKQLERLSEQVDKIEGCKNTTELMEAVENVKDQIRGNIEDYEHIIYDEEEEGYQTLNSLIKDYLDFLNELLGE